MKGEIKKSSMKRKISISRALAWLKIQ